MVSFLYDCHVHTSETSPCGKIAGREMVELYHQANYSGIVVTDHYFDGFFEPLGGAWEAQFQAYLQGYEQAYKRGQDLGVEVLLGLELRFVGSSNDYLIYGVDREFLLNHPRLDKLDVYSFGALARKHNLLVVQAHPFRSGMQVGPLEFLDGVEVYNGNPRHDSANHQALSYAQKHGLIQLACSDAHQYGDVARGAVELPYKVSTSRQLVELLKVSPILPTRVS